MGEDHQISREVLELHKSAFVVDCHADSILDTLPSSVPLLFELLRDHFRETEGNSPVPSKTAMSLGYVLEKAGIQPAGYESALEGGVRNLYERTAFGHLDFPRMLEAGIDLQFLAVFTEKEFRPERSVHRAMVLINQVWKQVEKFGRLQVVLSKRNLEESYSQHKPSVLISFEGSDPFDGDLDLVEAFYRLGVRCAQLTYNERNLIGDGHMQDRTKSKLTEFGVRVIEEMNRLGMVVDLSHMSETCFYDAVETSKQPVMVSHANCAAIKPSTRNLTDDQIRTLAGKGGVMGMLFASPGLLTDEPVARLEHIMKHLTHAVEIAGVNHVGLGSDFDGARKLPRGFKDVTDAVKLTESMLKHGFSEKEVRLILGENVVALLRAVLR